MPDSHFKELALKITGPVYPVCPAFYQNGDLDIASTEKYINYLIEHGAHHLMLTAGTSRFNLLTHREIQDLNKLLVNTVNGNATTIVANPLTGSTRDALIFAEQAQQLHADALLIYYPERYYTDQAIVEYFSSIGRICPDVGIMVHAYPMRPAALGYTSTVAFSPELVSSLCEIPNFIGMKEEHGNINIRQTLGKQFGNELSIIVAGTAMGMYDESAEFNINSYLVGLGSFKPEIEQEFFRLYRSGKIADARSIIQRLEIPFFKLAMSYGWHITMKGALNLLGLMPDYERLPLKPLSKVQRESIVDLLRKFGWLN